MDQAKRGDDALAAKNYDAAVKEYTAALAQNPSAVKYYIQRSTAHHRSANYSDALRDAEIAVVLAKNRAKRELIKDAQFRRAQTLFSLERYADSEYVLGVVKKLDEKEKSVALWEMKVQAKLKAFPEDDERRRVTVQDTPDVELPEPEEMKKGAGSVMENGEKTGEAKPAAPKPPVQTPVNQIKHDWYQNSDNVYFTLLAKGVPKDKATVEIQSQSLSISFPTVSGSEYDFSLEPLFSTINVSNSSFRITPTKIEVTLKKDTPGVKWSSLEGTETRGNGSNGTDSADPVKRAVLTSSADKAPSYPTSSRSGPKDWDKVAKDLTRRPKKGEEGDAGVTGKEKYEYDDDLDLEGGDDVNNFFKKLYAGADEDTRKAMMKSYQESNGTALSTNWGEVKTKTFETSPPDGMVAKKWGE